MRPLAIFIVLTFTFFSMFADARPLTLGRLNTLPVKVQDSFPYKKSIVSIGAVINGVYRHFCTGSLIRGRAVLTAGHCIEQFEELFAPHININDMDSDDLKKFGIQLKVLFNQDFQKMITESKNGVLLKKLKGQWISIDSWYAPRSGLMGDDIGIFKLSENAPDDIPLVPLLSGPLNDFDPYFLLMGFNYANSVGLLKSHYTTTFVHNYDFFDLSEEQVRQKLVDFQLSSMEFGP